jgi:WhiB family redox-sensing transcriptional regulator
VDRERHHAQFVDTTANPPWMQGAACAGLDPSLMVPDRHDVAGFKRAKAVCSGCPVKSPCLEYALLDDTLLGVWGETSWRQREDIRRDRRRALVGG